MLTENAARQAAAILKTKRAALQKSHSFPKCSHFSKGSRQVTNVLEGCETSIFTNRNMSNNTETILTESVKNILQKWKEEAQNEKKVDGGHASC